MRFSSDRKRTYANRHSINVLALSIALYASGIAAPTPAVEGSFVVSSGSTRSPRRASRPSFVQRTSPSSRALPSSPPPRAMAAADDEKSEDRKEPPVSGSFFYEVPHPKDEATSDDGKNKDDSIGNDAMTLETSEITTAEFSGGDFEMFEQIIQKTKLSRGGSKGFSKTTPTTDHAAPSIIRTVEPGGGAKGGSFVGIGRPLNDVSNPEYDENGYTLYADETTGEKRRVFEALVEYPSVFKMKIVGRDDEEGRSFAPEIVETVAKSCGVDSSMVKHTERRNGKWTSVTVHAPVRNADMLYALYESVDKDPRVKFKF